VKLCTWINWQVGKDVGSERSIPVFSGDSLASTRAVAQPNALLIRPLAKILSKIRYQNWQIHNHHLAAVKSNFSNSKSQWFHNSIPCCFCS